ncbi:hypothetical protein MASR2M39_22070 [Ignavibacteriales bacterium]
MGPKMTKKTTRKITTDFSEEEIQNLVVLPLLRSIGFKDGQLEFQNNLTLQLGHQNFEVDKRISGRLDILVKSIDGEKNLFVIEAKRDDIKFTNKEVEQVISYARLVHPIAPFAILVNGIEFSIYDTFTKELCDAGTDFNDPRIWNIRHGLKEDSEYIYEALKCLVGYNSINLKEFVKFQQMKRMSTLIGSIAEFKIKKYIPELYHAPDGLEATFQDFLSSDKPVFILTGEQGVGKTNAVCYLAQQVREQHIPFFYAGQVILRSLFELIRDDCNWFFSPQLTDIETVKRLVGLASPERRLIIFIDAVDEVVSRDFTRELNELVVSLKGQPNAKIVVSTKLFTAERFLRIGGEISDISEQIFRCGGKEENYSFKLNLFDDVTFKKIFDEYCDRLRITGGPPIDILEELHRGIALKVFGTVFKGKNVDQNIGFRDLFDEYLKNILLKIVDEHKARRILIEFCRFIFERNQTESQRHFSIDFVPEDDFRRHLNFGINDEIPSELFDYNILIRQPNQENNPTVGFYYSMVRDYMMVTKVLDIYSNGFEEFKKKIQELSRFEMGEELVYVTELFADEKHRTWMRKIYEENCEIFAYEIQRITDILDPELKSAIFKGIRSGIGFVFGEFQHPFYRGLRERFKDESTPVSYFSGDYDYELWSGKYRLKEFRIGGHFMLTADPVKLAHDEIIERVKKKVNEGLLKESETRVIELEVLFRLMQFNNYNLGLDFSNQPSNLPCCKSGFTIAQEKIRNSVKRYIAAKYLQNLSPRNLQLEIRSISRRWPATLNKVLNTRQTFVDIVNEFEGEVLDEYAYRGRLDDDIELKHIIDIIARWDEPSYSTPMTLWNPDLEKLLEIAISNPIDTETFFRESIIESYLEYEIEEYVTTFFKFFIEGYTDIIKTNFGSLSKSFQIFSELPIDIDFSLKYASNTLAYCLSRNGSSSVRCVEQIDYKENVFYGANCRLSDFFVSEKSYPLLRNYPDRISNSTVLRNFVYSRIESEIKSSNFKF